MYMQYMGETAYYKVFVNIVETFVKTPYGEIILLKGAGGLCGSLVPIDPREFEKFLTMDACESVYRVSRYGEIFVADQEHRDSYYHHLPGYLYIKDIKPGTIVPIHGIVSQEFLSDADKLCIADPKKVYEYMKHGKFTASEHVL